MITSITPTAGPVDKATYQGEDKLWADNRYNLYEILPKLNDEQRNKIEQQARSVACLVKRNKLINLPGSTNYEINSSVSSLADTLKTSYKTQCAEKNIPWSERTQLNYEGPFKNELCLAKGTAFLVGKQLVLTAAHCIIDKSSKAISSKKVDKLRVLFGFHMQSAEEVQTKFESKDVYRIDAVWQHCYKDRETDWALLKLDREVEGRDPLNVAASQKIPVDTTVYMLGYPSGLPLKLTLNGRVKKDHPRIFEAALNAYQGNSGSPVLENVTGRLCGMLFNGNNDYVLEYSQTNEHEVIIKVARVSPDVIQANGYEKCLKIGFVKKLLQAPFSGRNEYLANIRAHLAVLSATTRVQNLYGPEGVGKSALAVAFANQNCEGFSFFWLISCRTDAEQLIGYQDLARHLEIAFDENEKLFSLINKVNCKLEENHSKPWLLILDDLQKSPEPFPWLDCELLLNEPPSFHSVPLRGGSILITSYDRLNISSCLESAAIEVLPLEPSEAINFLKTATKINLDDCKRLLDHVGGCSPRELTKVASYINEGMEIEEYLANLNKRQRIFKTFKLEEDFNEALQKLSPSAKQWLFLCSELNAVLIPVSYLQAWLGKESHSKEQAEIIEAFDEKHLLLRYDTQTETFSLDLEFQNVLRLRTPAETIPQVVKLLVKVKRDWDFETTQNWVKSMQEATIWAFHAGPIAENFCRAPINRLERAFLLNSLGRWEYENTHYVKALAYYEEALKIYREEVFKIREVDFLRENHLNTATSLNGIGNCYFSQGKKDEALEVYNQVLEIRRDILGGDHLLVAASYGNIATCYAYKNDVQRSGEQFFEKALKAYNKGLEIYKIALGEGHCHVAASLDNIGSCYSSQGKKKEALQFHLKAIKVCRAALGEKHLYVAKSLNHIGSYYEFQKNYTEALKFYDAALKINRAAFGKKHPDLWESLHNIQNCYDLQGKFEDEQKVSDEMYGLHESSDHEYVGESLRYNNIYYGLQNNYSSTLNLYAEAIKFRGFIQGEKRKKEAYRLHWGFLSQKNLEEKRFDHPLFSTVGASRSRNVHGLCNNENQIDRRAALGENQQDVTKKLNKALAKSLEYIARYYYSKKNYNEALKMHRKVLVIREAIFGKNSCHPSVIKSLSDIRICQQLLNLKRPQQVPKDGNCIVS